MPKKRSLVYQRAGSGNWYITSIRKSAGTTVKADAEALAAKIGHESWLEERMGIKPPRAWKEAVVKWVDQKAQKVTIEEDQGKLDWLDAYFGTCMDLNDITRDRVDEIMQMRSGVSIREATPQNCTANKYVALVSGILHAAEREWGWGNRAPRLRYYKVLTDTGRALTLEEWRSLSVALRVHLRLAATFSVCTGLRAAKVFGLQWHQLDLTRATLTFAGTENKLGNTIPLNQSALAVLKSAKELPVVHKDNVFIYGGKPVKGYGRDCLQGAAERAAIGHVLWKDFRTTFNSWLAQEGVTREIRCRLMGHTTNEVQDRYTRLHVEHLRPFSCVIDTVLAQSIGQNVLSG